MLCIPYIQLVVRLGLSETLKSLIVVYTTFTMSFCILRLWSYFAQIPKEMREAAMVEGYSWLGAIRGASNIDLVSDLPGLRQIRLTEYRCIYYIGYKSVCTILHAV